MNNNLMNKIHHRITVTKKPDFRHIEDLSKTTNISLECFL